MGINLERTRSLLWDLTEEDPDSDAREQLILGSPQTTLARERAMVLLAAELLRDPSALLPGEPRPWLIDLSRARDRPVKLLFDGRLADLTGRVVDDLVAMGCSADQLVVWLEKRQRSASANAMA